MFSNEKQEKARSAGDPAKPGGVSRRAFLFGAGAFAGASLLDAGSAQASAIDKVLSLLTPEGKNINVENIKAYQRRQVDNRPLYENHFATRQELIDLIAPVPATDKNALEGTQFDHEAWFREEGFPAVQVRREYERSGSQIRFAQDQNIEPLQSAEGHLLGWGNGFAAGGVFMTNEHVSKREGLACEEIEHVGEDISGCSFDDMDLDEAMRSKLDVINSSWDRRKASVDLHGSLVHIPSINEQHTLASDNTEITTCIAIKITDAFLWSADKGADCFFNQKVTEQFGDVLRNSYVAVIAPIDCNGNSISDMDDMHGISGSPVYTDKDCADGRMIPSGIVWGVGAVHDLVRSVSYTVVFLHGPDVVGDMIDTVNTVVSPTMDEANHPQKHALTLMVQEALNNAGYALVADGTYGAATQKAVFDFQKRSFDSETLRSSVLLGDVDRITWDRLFETEKPLNKKALYELVQQGS